MYNENFSSVENLYIYSYIPINFYIIDFIILRKRFFYYFKRNCSFHTNRKFLFPHIKFITNNKFYLNICINNCFTKQTLNHYVFLPYVVIFIISRCSSIINKISIINHLPFSVYIDRT